MKHDSENNTTDEPAHITTYADLGGQLLRDAASFFRTIADQNEPLREQMSANADIFEEVANLLETNPMGNITETELGLNHHHHAHHHHSGGCCGGHHHHDEEEDDHESDSAKTGCSGQGACKH